MSASVKDVTESFLAAVNTGAFAKSAKASIGKRGTLMRLRVIWRRDSTMLWPYKECKPLITDLCALLADLGFLEELEDDISSVVELEDVNVQLDHTSGIVSTTIFLKKKQ